MPHMPSTIVLPTPTQTAGPIAEDLRDACRQARSQLSPDASMLMERLLAYTAEAEQRMAEQEWRIHQLESLSITDPLTGLLNRRGFEDALSRTLANAQRHGEQGVLAYIDLDGFKQINDTFGHSVGDDVLRHVSAILRQNVRGTDYVARLGGDEFAVIFTHAASPSLRSIVQKLKRCVGSSIAKVGNRMITVRASLGSAVYGPSTPAESLINGADKAMYAQKQRRISRAA